MGNTASGDSSYSFGCKDHNFSSGQERLDQRDLIPDHILGYLPTKLSVDRFVEDIRYYKGVSVAYDKNGASWGITDNPNNWEVVSNNYGQLCVENYGIYMINLDEGKRLLTKNPPEEIITSTNDLPRQIIGSNGIEVISDGLGNLTIKGTESTELQAKLDGIESIAFGRETEIANLKGEIEKLKPKEKILTLKKREKFSLDN